MRFGLLMVAALLAAALAAPAQAGATAAEWRIQGDRVFAHMTLPETTGITAMAQDTQGFLWIGSDARLMRWDGYRLRIYGQDAGEPGALPDNYIRALLVDAQGRLWIGTDAGGLNRYDPVRDAFVSIPVGPDGTRDPSVTALAEDGSGGLWIGTGKGVDHLDGRTQQVDAHARDLPDAAVNALLLDRHGALWVGTTAGLLRRPSGAAGFTPVRLEGAAGSEARISALAQDHAGRIWIGTEVHGAYQLAPDSSVPVALRETPDGRAMSDTITAICEVKDDELWLGTGNSGVVVVDAVHATMHREHHDSARPSSLASDEIQSLFVDRDGLAWVGGTAGLSRTDARQTLIQTFYGGTARDRLLDNGGVDAVLVLPDGRIWAALDDGGVDIVDPGVGRVGRLRPEAGPPEHSLPKASVNAMAYAGGSQVFLGTDAGLYYANVDGSAVAFAKLPWHKADLQVRSLLYAGQRLWVGASDGLWELRPHADGSVEFLRHFDKELGDARIASISPGENNAIWVGTNTGLARLDLATDHVRRMPVDPREPAALPGGYVSSVLTDRQGRLWVATFGRGIQVQTGQSPDGTPLFHRFTEREGLPQSSVDVMLMDGAGDIWVSTDDGLARIESANSTIHSYRVVRGVGFDGFWVGAGAATASGALIFGGLHGIVVLHPDRATSVPAPTAPLAITETRIDGRPVLDAARDLHLAAHERSLDIEFAALDYTDPDHRRYAYRLDGFDQDWVETPASRRLAAYTNLPPGDYVLELRSATGDGIWGAPLRLPVRVDAAWYQTTLARVLAAALGLALVVALVHLRTLVLRRQRRELERVVTERTDELRRSQAQLEQLVYRDALTGLANRRMFDEHLHRLLAVQHRGLGGFALLLVDLDDFKAINDTHGHVVGDALLVSVAAQLRTLVRETDLVVRLGGDEFAVLLAPTWDRKGIDSTCARIVASLGEPRTAAGRIVQAGASIGAVLTPHGRVTADELYRAADRALYAAKQAGRGTYRWGDVEAALAG